MIHEIATALLPVFFVLLLGYSAGLRKLVDNRHVSSINHLVMTFAIPAALFVSISSQKRSEITSHGTFIAVTTIAMLFVYALTLWLQLRVSRADKATAAIQALTVSFPNYASIALSIASTVLGSEADIAVAIGLAIGTATISPLTLALLEDATAAPDAPGSHISRFVAALGKSTRKPVFLAPILAFVIVLIGVRVPSLIETTLTPIGDVGAGGAAFLTGLVLSSQRVYFDLEVAYGIVMKNALMPLLVWGLCAIFGLNPLDTTEAILVTAVPCGFFGVVFAETYGIEPKLSSSTLLISTLAGIVSLSVVIVALPKHP